MRVGWKQEEGYSYARLGDCLIFVFEPEIYNYKYRVTVSLADKEKKSQEIDASGGVTTAAVQRAAVDWAIELGCKRKRRKIERSDEEIEWLEKLAEEILLQIKQSEKRYDDAEEFAHKHGYERPKATEYYLSTNYFPEYLEQHYLGEGHTTRQLSKAVALVLGRLESAGFIESMTFNRKRYWVSK